MNLNELEALLKKAFQEGGLQLEISDEDIEYLLARSQPAAGGQASKDLTPELEEILLAAIREKGRSNTVKSIEMAVRGESSPYCSRTSGVDESGCSVGEALQQTLRANGWTMEEAAKRFGVSLDLVKRLLAETKPFTRKTARAVVDSLARAHTPASRQLLTDHLLNGLRYWQLRQSGSAPAGGGPDRLQSGERLAARGKRSDKKIP